MSDGRFAGVHWASEEHAVCVVDGRGRIMEGRRYRHNEAGIRALCAKCDGQPRACLAAGLGLLVKLPWSADAGRAPVLGLPVQRAAFRPAPPGIPSRCPVSGNRRSRPERHQ